MSARIKTEPATYIATVEVPAHTAEGIAARLEAAEDPAALAVTLFDSGPGQVEVSAHYAEEPSRKLLMQLIAGIAGEVDSGALSIERLPPKNWVAEAEGRRDPVRAGRFLVHGRHDRGKVLR